MELIRADMLARCNVHCVHLRAGRVIGEQWAHNSTDNNYLAALAQWAAATASNFGGVPLVATPSQMQLGVGSGTTGHSDGALYSASHGLFTQTAAHASDGTTVSLTDSSVYNSYSPQYGAIWTAPPTTTTTTVVAINAGDTTVAVAAYPETNLSYTVTVDPGGTYPETVLIASQAVSGGNDTLTLAGGATFQHAHSNGVTVQITFTELVLLDPSYNCQAHVLLGTPAMFNAGDQFVATWQVLLAPGPAD